MNFPLSYLSPVLVLGALAPVPTDPPARPGPGSSAVGVSAAARQIDQLLLADMRRDKVKPNAVAGDATFLRRAYVAIIGRIPTAAESLRFLRSQANDKRAELVDQLLDSPGFDSHMFNFWADLLRVKTRLNNQVSGDPFIHFLKDSIAKNKPYDAFVREMVAAEGPAHARNNGATGLMMRDRGMPLDSMANTVRVFLGTRLECAQCHDHPFDKWKQKDFYQMAAFAGGINYRANLAQTPGARKVARLAADLRRSKDRNQSRALNQLLRRVTTGISGSGSGVIQLPKDYQYDDAKPREKVQARAIFGKTPKINYPKAKPRRGQSSRRRLSARQRKMLERQRQRRGRNNPGPQLGTRAVFADWLTDDNNERFAKVIANRLWKLVMGRGLIEPVDNITDQSKASNPALMRYLERLMVQSKFDLKRFLRTLFQTEAFQREANRTEVASDQKYHFQGPLLRRMTAEQVWDSMLTLVVPDTDKLLQPADARANAVYDAFDRVVNMSEAELREEVKRGALRYSDPQKFRAMQRENAAKAQRARRAAAMAKSRKAAELRKRAQPIYRALIKARRARDTEKVAELEGRLRALGIDPKARGRKSSQSSRSRNRGRNRNRTRLVRASDQQHPAPDGHFLRKFGQSDREQIQASHTEANVPQVLSLLNGFVENQVLANPGAELMRRINQASGPKEKVRQAFLGILNREPRGREVAMWSHDIESMGLDGVKDLVWTLVNTHEFRFVQ